MLLLGHTNETTAHACTGELLPKLPTVKINTDTSLREMIDGLLSDHFDFSKFNKEELLLCTAALINNKPPKLSDKNTENLKRNAKNVLEKFLDDKKVPDIDLTFPRNPIRLNPGRKPGIKKLSLKPGSKILKYPAPKQKSDKKSEGIF